MISILLLPNYIFVAPTQTQANNLPTFFLANQLPCEYDPSLLYYLSSYGPSLKLFILQNTGINLHGASFRYCHPTAQNPLTLRTSYKGQTT